MKRRKLVLLCVLYGMQACAIAHEVRPIGRGRGSLGLSLGGPIFDNLAAPTPVPHAVVQGRYGVGARTDIDAGVHLPVTRVTGVDVGAAHLILRQRGPVPAVMLGGRLLVFGDGRYFAGKAPLKALLFEEIYGLASWQLRGPWLAYGGLDAFAQWRSGFVHPTLLGGAQYTPHPRWQLRAELAWMAFTRSQRSLAVSYWGLGDLGAIGFHLGAAYVFGEPA